MILVMSASLKTVFSTTCDMSIFNDEEKLTRLNDRNVVIDKKLKKQIKVGKVDEDENQQLKVDTFFIDFANTGMGSLFSAEWVDPYIDSLSTCFGFDPI